MQEGMAWLMEVVRASLVQMSYGGTTIWITTAPNWTQVGLTTGD